MVDVAYKPIEKPPSLESFTPLPDVFPNLVESGAVGFGNSQFIKYGSQLVSGTNTLFTVPDGQVAYITGFFFSTIHNDAVNNANAFLRITRAGNVYVILSIHRFIKKAEIQSYAYNVNYNMPLILYAGDKLDLVVSTAGALTYADCTVNGWEKVI